MRAPNVIPTTNPEKTNNPDSMLSPKLRDLSPEVIPAADRPEIFPTEDSRNIGKEAPRAPEIRFIKACFIGVNGSKITTLIQMIFIGVVRLNEG